MKRVDIYRKDIHKYLYRGTHCGTYRTLFHLAASQQALSGSLLPFTDVENLGYRLPGRAHPPINVYAYPLVTPRPPFPFLVDPPASSETSSGKESDPHLRSAVGLSHTRTINLLKRFVSCSSHFHSLFNYGGRTGTLDLTLISRKFGTNIHILNSQKGMFRVRRFILFPPVPVLTIFCRDDVNHGILTFIPYEWCI